jgi:hypothetical protein
VAQKRVAFLFRLVNYIFAVHIYNEVIGLGLGLYTEKFILTAYCVGIAMVLNIVVISAVTKIFVPGWPCFKKNQIKFLPPTSELKTRKTK